MVELLSALHNITLRYNTLHYMHTVLLDSRANRVGALSPDRHCSYVCQLLPAVEVAVHCHMRDNEVQLNEVQLLAA
jgi:hypothetical protein